MIDTSRLHELEPLIGCWNTTIDMTEGGETTTHHATDTYRWALDKKFIFHDVAGEMAGQKLETLEIISVKGSRNFDLRSYDNQGEVGDYVASLDGHAWHIDGDALRFRGAFASDWRTLTGRWSRRAEGDWQDWLSIKLEKSVDGGR